MRKSLYCNRCRVRLTALLAIVSGKDPKVPEPLIEDRKPIVSRGVGFKAWKATPWIYREPGEPLAFVPQYWLNPLDLTDAVQLSRDTSRTIGCCGISGINGPNQLCRCKQEIGTLQDDCMTPCVFIPEPEATFWADCDSEYLDNP
ncbi:hypothetical protein [Sphingopyxis sp.]|uniref:hypothetical protein n=1 Tax=Sphingopyxis sp. TaxID=1908224 RepID=UPI002FC9A293